jgi:glycosyltransferase involved in cell wall biosynthesis
MQPRLLFLSANLPYPPHSGATNRTLHVIRELRRSFSVTLLAFARRQHQAGALQRATAQEALRQEVSVMLAPEPIAAEWSITCRLWNHGRSVMFGRPYTYYDYSSDRFAANLAAALSDSPPDLVHLDSLDLYRWCAGLPDVPITCTHHSIESELLRRRAECLSAPAAWYIRHQARLVEKVEQSVCPAFALNLMMSDREADALRRLVPTARTLVVPNAVDTEHLHPRPAAGRVPSRLVFVGPMYVFANRDAVSNFLSAAWPTVREIVPDASLRVVGSCPRDARKQLEKVPGVVCVGKVDDLTAELAQAACAIVPLRLGGGTRLKILDAWAMATPVVATSIGCEGLAAEDGTNILIADEPGEFARAVGTVLHDPDLARRLGESARRTVEEHYDWRKIGVTLRAAYHGLVENHKQARR